MKTLRKISLAILLCLFGLTALASCDSNKEADPVLSKILLIQEGEDVDADFTVPKTVKYNSETHNISWSSSDDKLLSFVENEDESLLTADIHQPFDEDKDVTLTASREVNGKKVSTSFKTTVVKIDKEKAMTNAINNVGVEASYSEATTVELPSKSNEYYEEITFAFVLDGTYSSSTLTGNTLAMDPTIASEDVDLKVTATCGETVVTKTLTIAVTAALYAEGMPYVLRLYQGNLEKNLYLTSQMSGYYAKTTDNPAAAEAVYLESTQGGYYMYFLIEGAKTYINVVPSGTYRNIKFEATASSVWSLNGTYNTLTTLIEGEEYYLGAYNSYDTVGPSAISYAETSFPFHLEIGTGLAYNMYSEQGNVNKTLYLTGEMSGYYAKTTEDVTKASSVYFETTEGGYYMYMLSGETKTYINVVPSGTYRNIKFEATASSVWNVNAEYSTVSTIVEGEEYYLGTYGNYETVGPSAISYAATSFPCHFGVGSGAAGSAPVIDTIPEEAVNLTVSNEGKLWFRDGENANVTEHMTSEAYVTITAYKNGWELNSANPVDTQGYFYLSATTARLYAAEEGTNGSSLEIKVGSGYQIDNLYLFLESGEVAVLVGGNAVSIAEGKTNTYVVNANTVVLQNQGSKVAKIEAIAFTVSDAHVHEHSTEWSHDATNHWHACACGDKADLAAHTFGEWTTVTAAGNGTCGSEERVCACGAKETRTTHSVATTWSYDANGHWHASTCACTDKHDQAAHTFGEWTTVTAAGNGACGKEERACACGYKEEKTTHSVATTWSYDANSHWHASTCACTDKHDVATHTFGEWTEVTPATEDADGVKERACACGYVETGAIPALNHTHNHDLTTWKYDETNHWNECKCGDKINVATHTFGEWTEVTPAGNGVCGTKKRECTCGYVETAATHAVATEWSFDETGHWHASTCACIDKHDQAAHTFGEWSVKTPSTDTVPGVKARACECGYEETLELPLATLYTGELAATSLGAEQVATSEAPTADLSKQINQITPIMASAVASRNSAVNSYAVYFSSSSLRLYGNTKTEGTIYDATDLTTIGGSIEFTVLPGLTVKTIEFTFDTSKATDILVIVNGQLVEATEGVYTIHASKFTIAASSSSQIRVTGMEISYYGDADLTDANNYQNYYLGATGTALEEISGNVVTAGADYATVKATDGFTYYVKAATTLADWETKFVAGNIVTIPNGVKGNLEGQPTYTISSLENVTSQEVLVSWADYMAATANTAIGKMKGVVTASNGKGSAMLAVYENNAYVGSVYVYGATTFSDWNTVFVVGKEVTLNQGTKAIYNTLHEYKLAALTDAVLGGDGTIPPHQDVTSIVASVTSLADMKTALTPYQGALITITGVYTGGLLTSNTDTTIGLKYYYSSYYLASAPTVTMTEGSTYTVTGFLDVYNGTYEITPLSSDAITAN